jgi:hypothetical protein
MSFARPWWLLGLLLLVPLVLLHLRRRDRNVQEIASLIVWRDVGRTRAPSPQRRRPPRPWPLLLQALIVTLVVGALAEPVVSRQAAPALRVLVLDTSFWMKAHNRLEQARARLAQSAVDASRVAVVVAGATPRIVYEGDESGALSALEAARPEPGYADLAAALATAASLHPERVVVARAPEDELPAIAGVGDVRVATVGTPLHDLALVSPRARCGVGGPTGCEIVVQLVNVGTQRARVLVQAAVDRGRATAFVANAPPHGSVPVALAATPRAHVTVRIATPDALPDDDALYVVVPGTADTAPHAVVTLVGRPPQASALARAFGAVPGVALRLRTPIEFNPADAAASDLVVLDGDAAQAGLPPSPAVLVVHPARFAGGPRPRATRDAVAATSAEDDPLLAGVDLTSLAIDPGATRRYALPAWMQPLAVADAVPLVAAGSDGRRRVALLAFEPSRSNLAQLEAFPVLARNLVRWAAGWAPASAAAGHPFVVQWLPTATTPVVAGGATAHGATGAAAVAGLPPGEYRVVEREPDRGRQADVAVSQEPEQPHTVSVGAASPARRITHVAWWFIVLALGCVAGELAIGPRTLR